MFTRIIRCLERNQYQVLFSADGLDVSSSEVHIVLPYAGSYIIKETCKLLGKYDSDWEEASNLDEVESIIANWFNSASTLTLTYNKTVLIIKNSSEATI